MQIGFTCEAVERSDGTWDMQNGSGGARGGRKRSSLKVNLGGIAGSTDQFYAGGYIEPNGHSVTRVQLVSANNVVLEDTVNDDIVLLLDDRFIQFPMEARLYDAHGALLNTHPVLPG